YTRSPLAIGHRGAVLFFPEHTREGYLAAVRQGAGFVERDAVPTKDSALICRHSEGDLAKTTNVLATPLAAKCRKGFRPGKKADFRTTNLTLAEFLSLEGWPGGSDKDARKPEGCYRAVPAWRTLAYAPGTVVSHRGYTELLLPMGVNFIPELKDASLPSGLSLDEYRRRIVDGYRELGCRRSGSTCKASAWKRSASGVATRRSTQGTPSGSTGATRSAASTRHIPRGSSRRWKSWPPKGCAT
ncbi:glycerophosphodiester phosphodiesterase family protein, partial [Oceanithermus sp.]